MRRWSTAATRLLVLFAALAISRHAAATTFTVINTDDSGTGSLRQAITDAGAGGPGPHTITFNIPGSGVHGIVLASGLPAISIPTGGLTIDATTQPGYAGSPLVAITCDNPSFLVFEFFNSAVTLKGLSVGNCGTVMSAGSGGPIVVLACHIGVDAAGTTIAPNSSGISLAGASFQIGSPNVADRNIISGNTVYGMFIGDLTSGTIGGNFVGTDVTGTVAIPNGTGISIQGGLGSGILVGGAAGENLISGNENNGVEALGMPDVTIRGNLIGVDISGELPLGNKNAGIKAYGTGLIIGGPANSDGNLVSGNLTGMDLGPSEGMIVQSNIIGLDDGHTQPIPNVGPGILLKSPGGAGSSNLIGTSAPGGTGANLIAFNGGVGILVAAGDRNTMRGNSIHDNNALAVSLGGTDKPLPNDPGDANGYVINGGQNFPIIASATQEGSDLHILGTLNSHASTTFDIDFYSNPACARFPHDFLQAQAWIGATQVTTDGSGITAIDVTLPGVVVDSGARISSTATDPQGNTSEISQRIVIGSTPLSAPAAAGSVLTLDGMLFEPGGSVDFSGTPGTNYTFQSNTSVQITTPALIPGSIADITLHDPSGLFGTLPRGYVAQFSDVTNPGFAPYIAGLVANGLTVGCGGPNYCPIASVLRQQMAVFLLRGKYGLCYTPPPCTGTVFGDVHCQGNPFDPWIEALASLQITGGCGGGNYCPLAPVIRQQMATFLLKALEGSTYVPPDCTNPFFGDVPCDYPFANWIYDLAARGITGGCAVPGDFCPTDPVLRQQMAVFLVKTFSLPF